MIKRGNLIVIEGADGVGKTTLTRALAEHLCKIGLDARAYAFPGNDKGTLGSLVYRLHHDHQALGVDSIAPIAVQALHIAAHLDAIKNVLRPILERGENIVLDRFWWSTLVYGRLSGVELDVLDALICAERKCWGAMTPLVVFLVDSRRPWRKSEDTPVWYQLAHEYRAVASQEQAGGTAVVVAKNESHIDRIVEGMAQTVLSLVSER